MSSWEVRARGADEVGVAESFEDLYRRQLEPMVRMASLMLGSRELAVEAAHDGFAKLFERFDRVDDPVRYLRSCVANRCRDLQRRRRLEWRHPQERPQIASLQARELLDAVGRLAYRQRAVLVLRFYLGLSERDTAETLGISVGTVKSRTSRAIAELRKEIV
jgi:RNA polymerase sigma factor (sigma-70 family)